MNIGMKIYRDLCKHLSRCY